MAKWHWKNVKEVRGWTQFDNFIDIQVVQNDGTDNLLRIWTADDNDTITVNQFVGDKLVNCECDGEPGYCEQCQEVHHAR